MKTHPTSTLSAPRRAARQPGLAIVVVVSLMALLMLLVLAFLLTSSTNRSISSTDVAIRQADSLADLAKETVIADLIGEMKDGSKNTNQNEDGTYSFDIEDPKSMVPFRAVNSGIGSSDDFNLIVKQSASGVKFSNGGSALDRASNVSTNTKDLDGRKIAEKRWSAPKLFPLGVDLTQNQVPDWIYTTRDGSNPTSFSPENSRSLDSSGEPSPDYVVGRYAYQVYDVSGLLDANVAGNVTASAPANVLSRKGSLVWADLSVLPNSGGNLAGLADWRRISSKNWPKGDSASGVEDFIREWGGVKGWMKTPLVNNTSDNLFLSRQDLINYQKSNPSVISEDLLPYFTINNLQWNRPSWAPTINAPTAGYEYKNNQDSTTALNRRIERVRVKNNFKRWDGSMAVPGEPLMKTRFPLSKLNAFETKNQEDIEKYFNLTQSGGPTTWIYKGSTSPTILTLEEVASEGREPDFFELLQAGLLEGSIANTMAGKSYFEDVLRDQASLYQIFRIGACIIDQWDEDDDPTVIELGDVNTASDVRELNAIGVENLPYFHVIGRPTFRRRDLASFPNDSTVTTFHTFQLWNPHKNPTEGKIANGDFRLAFAGGGHIRWQESPVIITPIRNASLPNDYISFSVSNSLSFSNPTFLKSTTPSVSTSKADDRIDREIPIVGFCFGKLEAPYTSKPNHNQRYNFRSFAETDPSMTYVLQKNVGGAWLNYQIIPEFNQDRVLIPQFIIDDTDLMVTHQGAYSHGIYVFTDPRTTRYGVSFAFSKENYKIFNRATSKDYSPGDAEISCDEGFKPPSNWTVNPVGRRPTEFASNAPNGNTVVRNQDGIRRPADAGELFTNPEHRPEILNRPFQSLADLGNVFRDDPWTSLNLYGDPDDPNYTGDGALLDFFSLTEPSKRTGVINPNAAPVAVLTSLLNQAAIREGSVLDKSSAEGYATEIRKELDNNPFINMGDFPRLAAKITKSKPIKGFQSNRDRNVILRALGDVANLRTWNFMIDVVAQSGKLRGGASNLENFNVGAESRYWYHVSIDRYAGEILHLSKERISQ
jgi:type II secretory pathway pseudopilin PulG